MDFEESLRYMSGLIRFGWKLGNERMEALCERLGSPQNRYAIVHVAGTKGKGSTTALTAAVLHAAGYNVGAYFSPYVYDVRERVQVNGERIPRDDFARLVTQVRPHIEALAETEIGQTTEFELKTLLSFLYFAERKVDFACLEVGIGGRLDATNVVRPTITVITNIGLDHTEILGETHAQIAAEKAGIIKPGIPCITATENPEALAVIAQIAEERGAPLYLVRLEEGERWRVAPVVHPAVETASGKAQSRPAPTGPHPGSTAPPLRAPQRTPRSPKSGRGANSDSSSSLPSLGEGESEVSRRRPTLSFGGSGFNRPNAPLSAPEHAVGEGGSHFAPVTIETSTHLYLELEMRMGGLYQRANAACAVAAAEMALKAQGEDLPESAVRTGLAETALPGRLTVVRLSDGPLVVLDGAHNALAAQSLAGPIRLLREQYRLSRLFLVIGMVGGHSPDGVLGALAPGADRVYACQPGWKRAQPAESIAEAARKWVSEVEVIPSVEQAVRAALRAAGLDTLVLVTGSFYTVGEVPVENLAEWSRPA